MALVVSKLYFLFVTEITINHNPLQHYVVRTSSVLLKIKKPMPALGERCLGLFVHAEAEERRRSEAGRRVLHEIREPSAGETLTAG